MSELENKPAMAPKADGKPQKQDVMAIAQEAMIAAQQKAIENARRYGMEPVLVEQDGK